MLAIRNSMAKAFFVPSLVFDEVDSGIGGAQAEIVGRKLAAVAKLHQVLCITHLPQIAGLAGRHIVVSKQVKKGRTTTVVKEATGEERERELARMVGGMKITDATRAAAREMMKR
jgi:DNA repair protein RecN (Recombination protein N)